MKVKFPKLLYQIPKIIVLLQQSYNFFAKNPHKCGLKNLKFSLMRQYISNLLTALVGKNPFEKELKELRNEYEQAAERVRQLDMMYKDAYSMMNTYQILVENLRERIKEKDELLNKMMVGEPSTSGQTV